MRRTRVLWWPAISVLFVRPALAAPQAPDFRLQDHG